jgi:hypothetical protein
VGGGVGGHYAILRRREWRPDSHIPLCEDVDERRFIVQVILSEMLRPFYIALYIADVLIKIKKTFKILATSCFLTIGIIFFMQQKLSFVNLLR